MLREYNSPGNAVRFSSVCTRLLARPVLAHKWAILYLLHQLATPGFGDEDWSSSSPASSMAGGDETPQTTIRQPEVNLSHPVLFSPQKVLPTAEPPRLTSSYRSLSTESAQTTSSTERVDRREPEEVHEEAPKNVPFRDMDEPQTLPTEAALLRDLPFTLQGLSTKHLSFASSSTINIPPRLPLPLVSLLHTLAEPALLYRGLSETVQAPVEGLIAQSLIAAIGNELRSYLALIATLEGEIRRFLSSLDANGRQGGVGKVGVTLKRCVVWTREATMGLRLMSLMTERAKSRSGHLVIRYHFGLMESQVGRAVD